MGIIDRYREHLPVTGKTPVISLNEGGTPLVAVDRLGQKLNLPKESLYCKVEGANPTGSFKDRGMTLAISKAVEEGAKAVVCASTGNTAASAAAYAARAGLPCFVFLPKGHVAAGKLSQAVIHGAKVIEVKGNFDQCLKLVREAAVRFNLTIVNSTNPYRLEGQKTAAFEICSALGRAPDYQFMPVGNAGNITAYWRGYKEYLRNQQLPRMMGFQAKGAAPIVLGKPVKNPATVATAIRIGHPASWKGALAARDESGGAIDTVTDKEILEAYRLLAQTEGVFCEPSSAAGVAGLIKYAKNRRLKIESGMKIVCILTGHGLKDPDSPFRFKSKSMTVKPDMKSVEAALKRILR
ncbi:MAG: threonine synthase [Elusimicrobia bacterium]|nr:threonine synthase [Elusimicrobiota bacterium]